MAFTVREFHDLIGLLEQHPEWRAELRRLLLTEEVLTLPQAVRELAEAQRRTEQQVAELAAAQRRTEQRVVHLQGDVGDLKDMLLEDRYRERAFAYFFRLVRRARVVFGDELVTLLEDAVAQGHLSEAGAEDVARADVVVRGRRREDETEVYLVAEVSWGVGPSDIEQAVQRAALLAQVGVQTVPVVAGQSITAAAAELSRAMQVW
jgi:hypothetical protein